MAIGKHQISLLDRITRVISESHDFRETVDNIVSLVKEEMKTDVCSLYLYNEERNRLYLVATEGLDTTAIGKVEMEPSEGLTGMVFETMTPLVVQDAHKHPRFRYFPVTREEKFKTFLGVPLISRKSPLGVLVVQDRKNRSYDTQELQLFNTIAGQVAGVVVNARLLRELTSGSPATLPVPEPERSSLILHGTAATPGIAMGPAVLMEVHDDFHYIVEEKADDPEMEKKKFLEAAEAGRKEIVILQERVQEQLGEEDAGIFNIHLMMLEDQGFNQKVQEVIDSGTTALYAVKSVLAGYLKSFQDIDDQYLRDRAVDIEDVGRRIIRLLSDQSRDGSLHFHEEGILITRLITPSDAAVLSMEKVQGVATSGGGHTSHAIILSRSLGIPCIVGVEELLEVVQPGDYVIVDGNTGNIFINPDEPIVKEYERLRKDYARHVVELVSENELPAVTLDGYKVDLMANVGLLSDLKFIDYYGAEGIGLYRTELPFMARSILPTEDEQYRIYRTMVEGTKGKTVNIRTLDVGGDKSIPYLGFPTEENPFLGWRSIRMCLEKADIFKTQIRAIMRAARHGPVSIMIPMVSNLDEVVSTRRLIDESGMELRSSKIPHDSSVKVGLMIEVPSAALLAGKMAREVDFFSIGTNDLTQYTLAVDRNNKRVAHMYDPMNPAILNLIFLSARAAREAGIPVAVCGEIAADPLWTPLLIGLGISGLSMNASSIPLIKRSIRLIRHEDCLRAARRALKAGTSADVRRIMSRFERMIQTEVVFKPTELH
ncbi:MAG: phosphoenolpyruvate--protein phosphotransferase [bacterium]|nr:MAG: phosphoenolpyruvate--protein phosphotransferase [bacterium]